MLFRETPIHVHYIIFFILGVWTADVSNSAAVLEIGKKLKDRLNIPPRTTLGYQVHTDTMDKNSSVSKFTYTV